MKKVNNWKLIAFLGGLVIIFILIKVLYSPRLETNLPKNLTDIDSAVVTSMVIQPADNQDVEITLALDGGKWVLRNEDENLNIEPSLATTALSSLMNLKPLRIISKKSDNWSKYGVVDSLGTRVKVMSKNSVEADIIVGRSNFLSSPGGGIGGSQTFVRRADEDEVYVVAAFLDGQFNRSLDDWRDKRFTELKPDSIDKISFMYPADSSFVLELTDEKWRIGNQFGDSTLVTNYLEGLRSKRISKFSSLPPVGDAPFVIEFQFEGDVVGKLEAWTSGGDYWIMRTYLQPDYYVTSEQTSIVKDIWVGRNQFLKQN